MNDNSVTIGGGTFNNSGALAFGAHSAASTGRGGPASLAPVLERTEVDALQVQLADLRALLDDQIKAAAAHNRADRDTLEVAIAQTDAVQNSLGSAEPRRKVIQALLTSVAASVKDIATISDFVTGIVHTITGPS